MTVPAVPDAEPVEPDRALQRRQSREQHHLDEREIGGKQAGNPPDAREELPRRARLQVAAMNPEPDDHRRIRKHDRVHDSRRCVAPQRRRPPPDRRRTPERNDLIHTFHATNRRLESAEERLRSNFPLVSSQSTEDPRNERRTYPPRRCGDPDGASRINGPSGTSGDGVPTSARGDAVQRRARRGGTLRGRDSHVGYESLAQRSRTRRRPRLRQGYAVEYAPARWHEGSTLCRGVTPASGSHWPRYVRPAGPYRTRLGQFALCRRRYTRSVADEDDGGEAAS